jgi:lysozyme family protein
MNFDQALAIVLKHEGGYVNHPSDPGGETNFGITKAVAQRNGYHGDMRDIPMDVVARIYRKGYWDAVRADEMPQEVRYAVFDAAVNSGPGQAIRWLQRAVNVKDDGVLGPQTLLAVRMQNPEVLLRRVLAQRLKFMSGLSNWPAFSRGWARRIADLMET